jgi:hypothetical protein
VGCGLILWKVFNPFLVVVSIGLCSCQLGPGDRGVRYGFVNHCGFAVEVTTVEEDGPRVLIDDGESAFFKSIDQSQDDQFEVSVSGGPSVRFRSQVSQFVIEGSGCPVGP